MAGPGPRKETMAEVAVASLGRPLSPSVLSYIPSPCFLPPLTSGTLEVNSKITSGAASPHHVRARIVT
jgi:hypothetical protein